MKKDRNEKTFLSPEEAYAELQAFWSTSLNEALQMNCLRHTQSEERALAEHM